MKTSKLLVGLAFVGMTAAACSVKTKTTGSSGVGGDVGGATVTSTTTTVGVGPTSTTTATTSTSTGGSGCDDGTMGDSGSAECSSCLQCAAGLYGATTGLSTASCSGVCPPGYVCSGTVMISCLRTSLRLVSERMCMYVRVVYCRWHSVAAIVDGVCVNNRIDECIGDRERLQHDYLLSVSVGDWVGFTVC